MAGVSRDFIKYASGLFKRSLIGGIPKIVTAKSSFRKTARIVVFVFCILGFMYQSVEFYLMYIKYPSVIDVQLTTPVETILPAVTGCSYSGLSRFEYCALNPCRLIRREKLCRRYPIHCYENLANQGMENHQMPYSNFSELYWKTDAQIAKYRSVLFQTKFIHMLCRVSPKGPENSTWCSAEFSPSVRGPLKIPPVCITHNSRVGNPNSEPQKATRAGSFSYYRKLPPYDIMTGPRVSTFQVSLHTPYSVSNPFIDGMAFENGISYRFKIKEIVKIRLPAPYETDCMDYMELWKQRGGYGPLDKMQCIEECKVNHSMADYGCVMHTIWYPHSERRCDPGGADEKQLEYAEKCSPKCKQACREISYELKKEEFTSHVHYNCQRFFAIFKAYNSHLEFPFSNMERVTYHYKPKYEFVEVVSYIGGYIGIWLGISLIALLNFIETVIMIVIYPIMRKMKERERRRVRIFRREELREHHPFRRNSIMHM